MTTPSLSIKRGDTWIFTAKFRTAAGTAIDLADCAVRSWLTQAGNAAAILELSTVSGELTLVEDADETPGLLCNVRCEVDSDLMALLDPGAYEFDLEVTFSDARVLSTATIGLTVVEDKTL